MTTDFTDVRTLLLASPGPPGDVPSGPINDQQLRLLESQLGFRLPSDLVDWLHICNGSPKGPGGLFGAGIERDLDIAQYSDMFPELRQRRMIPVAGDGCGNYYFLVTGAEPLRGAVAFVDTMASDNEISYVVASSLPRFLEGLLRRELGELRWPFDASFVLAHDPQLARFPLRMLPWGK